MGLRFELACFFMTALFFAGVFAFGAVFLSTLGGLTRGARVLPVVLGFEIPPRLGAELTVLVTVLVVAITISICDYSAVVVSSRGLVKRRIN